MISEFERRGFVRIDDAFSRDLAAQARAILWRDVGARGDRPVVRLGMYTDPPFLAAGNSARLTDAYDALVGKGRWRPVEAMGTFPIRFPSLVPPNDVGWHVDMSLDYHLPDFMDWRINVRSDGRRLLMLFLFSDVGENDAPTKLRAGSHHEIARLLAPHGERGLALRELARNGFAETESYDEALATGPAGTVYLCHPFVVHSAQAHRGTEPKFMAQPPLLLRS